MMPHAAGASISAFGSAKAGVGSKNGELVVSFKASAVPVPDPRGARERNGNGREQGE